MVKGGNSNIYEYQESYLYIHTYIYEETQTRIYIYTYIYMYVQPVPEKTGLKMVNEMQIEILNGGDILFN